MGNQPKVHFIRIASWGRNVMCGHAGTFTSEDKEKVTCKTCIKLAEKINWRTK